MEKTLILFGRRNVNLKITSRAREAIERYKQSSKLANPLLKIGWGKWSDETTERWTIGFYDRNKIQEGWVGSTDEFEFVVIQEWILDALDGKTIDISESGITVE